MELLVAISVAAILLGIGIPSFRATIASNRLATQTNDFLTALSRARSEAMKRGVRVTVCRSTNGTTCATGSGTGGWERGWIVYAENAGNIGTFDASARTYGAGTSLAAPILGNDNVVVSEGSILDADVTTQPDQLLQSRAALAGGNTLRGDSNLVNRITYNHQGMSNTFGSVTLCDSKRAGYKREVIVAATGRVRITKSDGDGTGC